MKAMRLIPFDPRDATTLTAAALGPIAPLPLTIVPLDELLEMAGKLLL